MANSIRDQAKLDELETALGIAEVRHGDNRTVFVQDTSKMRAELRRRLRQAEGVRRTRVRYLMQSSKGY